MKKYLVFLTLSLLAFTSYAKDAYVDLRDVNIVGQVKEVSAPNILKVETYRDGKRQHFWIELVHVDFGDVRDNQCTTGHKFFSPKNPHYPFRNSLQLSPDTAEACQLMKDWLAGEMVSIEITEWSEPVLKGFVFLGSTNINYTLIEKGWYRVDYMQTRDATLALLEKKARCARVGIWKSKSGIPEEDLKCQE